MSACGKHSSFDPCPTRDPRCAAEREKLTLAMTRIKPAQTVNPLQDDDAPPIFTPPEDILKSRLRELQFVVSALREKNSGLEQENRELKQMIGMMPKTPKAKAESVKDEPKPESTEKKPLTGAQRAKACRERKKQQQEGARAH